MRPRADGIRIQVVSSWTSSEVIGLNRREWMLVVVENIVVPTPGHTLNATGSTANHPGSIEACNRATSFAACSP